MDHVRIGILGAARIAPAAIIKPAQAVDDAEVVAVAARDRSRAEKFAAKRGVPRVHDSYDALIADPEIDAIYNPLPNGLHAEWTLKALAAGKHVLCEKPFTANAAEAEEVAAAADASGLVVMEAFHYRYHPLARRMKEVVDTGVLGDIQRVETAMCIPLPLKNDIRYRLDLAGGATMDVGCYALHMARLMGGEPDVAAARYKLSAPDVDRWMQADLAFPGGATGQMTCSLMSRQLLKVSVKVTGTEGAMKVLNPTAQFHHRLTLRVGCRTTRENFGRKPTYEYQLDAFTGAVLRGEPTLTPPSDSILNMRAIDAVYRAAGLPLRGSVS
ncbi:MAG TPA: Gfo/Idh/MocA family oxidoreductase [Acidimicrobiia bacterium]